LDIVLVDALGTEGIDEPLADDAKGAQIELQPGMDSMHVISSDEDDDGDATDEDDYINVAIFIADSDVDDDELQDAATLVPMVIPVFSEAMPLADPVDPRNQAKLKQSLKRRDDSEDDGPSAGKSKHGKRGKGKGKKGKGRGKRSKGKGKSVVMKGKMKGKGVLESIGIGIEGHDCVLAVCEGKSTSSASAGPDHDEHDSAEDPHAVRDEVLPHAVRHAVRDDVDDRHEVVPHAVRDEVIPHAVGHAVVTDLPSPDSLVAILKGFDDTVQEVFSCLPLKFWPTSTTHGRWSYTVKVDNIAFSVLLRNRSFFLECNSSGSRVRKAFSFRTMDATTAFSSLKAVYEA